MVSFSRPGSAKIELLVLKTSYLMLPRPTLVAAELKTLVFTKMFPKCSQSGPKVVPEHFHSDPKVIFK